MDRLKNARRIRRTVTAVRLGLLALLVTITAGTVSGAETADTLKLRTWRLAAQGADGDGICRPFSRGPG